jgi:hypothetical protein
MAPSCAIERLHLAASAGPRGSSGQGNRRVAFPLLAYSSRRSDWRVYQRVSSAPYVRRTRASATGTASASASSNGSAPEVSEKKPLKVLVAGGGIGGLAAAIACRQQGLGECHDRACRKGHLPCHHIAAHYATLFRISVEFLLGASSVFRCRSVPF